MRKVTVSIWPDQEIEVDESEYADLVAQGLVKPDKPAQSGKEETRDGGNRN